MAFSAPPAMVIGHSLGEYAAYVAGGVFDFADGFAGVMARAEAVSELPSDRRGTMLAVRIKDAAVQKINTQKINMHKQKKQEPPTVLPQLDWSYLKSARL